MKTGVSKKSWFFFTVHPTIDIEQLCKLFYDRCKNGDPLLIFIFVKTKLQFYMLKNIISEVNNNQVLENIFF
jgi:hypothetical protein